jgi:hypothetical protein
VTILHARPGACHPISRYKLAREPVALNCEGGSSAAMAVDGGRRSWSKKAGEWEYGSVRSVPSHVYTPLQAAAHRARCSTYPGTDRWAQDPLISRRWTVRWWCSSAETKSPCILYVWCPVGLGNVAMIASGLVISAEQ